VLTTVKKGGAQVHPWEVGIPMTASVKFASVCVGVPIVALWVGGATAWAAPSTSGESSDATPARQTTNNGLAISVGENARLQFGTAKATASGSSLAIALNGTATANGTGNVAVALFNSTATANGDRNFVLGLMGSTATANGNRNFVFAGDDSTASATGDDNDVRAAFGSRNHVTGDGNTSFAIPQSTAEVKGNNNLAVSLCGGSVTISGQSDQIRTSAPCLGR
jgi:hypothetical protein